MIRMGRSAAKPEQPAAAKSPLESASGDANRIQPSSNFAHTNQETAAFRPLGDANNRAFTESEGLARDIKEGRLSGYVGAGTTLMGETEFKSLLRVDGHLVGKIMSADGTLQIGASGQIDANIRVAAAIINGTVNGDVFASERIEIGRTGKVIGNIQAPSLIIEQGALLEGNCSMMKPKAEFDKRAAQAARESLPPETGAAQATADEPENQRSGVIVNEIVSAAR